MYTYLYLIKMNLINLYFPGYIYIDPCDIEESYQLLFIFYCVVIENIEVDVFLITTSNSEVAYRIDLN